MKDEAILTASVKNPSLFGIIIDRYQTPLFRAAFSVVHQKEEAEDIVQEAFTKMYLKATSFEKQKNASFKSWAYRITINNAISHYRKLKRTFENQTSLDPEIYKNLPGKENVKREAEAKILSDQLLAEIPEDVRRAVELYYLEGKSYKTIATEEGIPLSTLKMRLFRAKKMLKSFIS